MMLFFIINFDNKKVWRISGMASLDKSTIAAIGEYMVLAELLQRGYKAYLAHGPTNKGWDILVEGDNMFIKLQVKTTTKATITISPASRIGSDYTIIVLLGIPSQVDTQSNNRYLILSRKEVEKSISQKEEKRKDNNRTLTVNKILKDAYEDKWSKIL